LQERGDDVLRKRKGTTGRLDMQEEKPKPLSRVVLVKIPPGSLNDLPIEDQRAISEIVGKPVRLNEYDVDGRAELEFKDSSGVIHFIYVNPEFIRAAD
jgi:hypothetical protein